LKEEVQYIHEKILTVAHLNFVTLLRNLYRLKIREEILWRLFDVRLPDVYLPIRVEKFLYGVQNVALGGVASMVKKEILALVVDISISLENK
jgi:hypothetical protein